MEKKCLLMAEPAPFDLEKHAMKFAPEYGEHDFSDHLPMAVTALRQLGGSQERVDAFVKGYQKRLKRRQPGKTTIGELLLSARIGDASVYAPAFNYFSQAIESDGRAHVLRSHLPELTNALATVAFHGAIRVAYGLLADSDTEVAAGLAYWHSRAVFVRFSRSRSIGAANNNAETLLDDVADAFAKSRSKLKLDQPTISEQLSEVFANPQLATVLNKAAAANVSFDEIAAYAMRIYLASENFTALHCVTGVHATRILSDHVVMDDAVLRKSLWSSICAAYASIRAPALQPLTPAPTGAPDWHVISSAAQGAEDEHDIKFAFSCMEESRQYGRDAHYRYAAAKRLGLIT